MKRFALPAALSCLILAGCASRPKSIPWPRRVGDMPPCYIAGRPGTWICDERADKRCVCVSKQAAADWWKRNVSP